MGYWKVKGKRFVTDAAGYSLLIAAVFTGWLPGPGGIPIAMLGLGLLSVHNVWAQDLRIYFTKKGGDITPLIFPETRWVRWLYDVMTILLFMLSSLLIWVHAEMWEVSLAVIGYFIALTIVLMNRDRAGLQRRKNRKST